MIQPSVVHVPERSRWEVRVGDQVAGFTEYFVKDDRFVFFHTEIDDEFDGRGLGSTLARRALDEVRSTETMLVPICPFIRGWIERHPAYADLVDEAMLAEFDARRARRSGG